MNLTDAQKEQVKAWIHGGLKLSEIQNRLISDFSLRLTYMEVRFLVDELKVMPIDPEPPVPPVVVPAPAAKEKGAAASPSGAADAPDLEDEDAPAEGNPLPEPGPAPGTGKVSLSVDTLAVPGAMVSGKVTFSDGQQAQWYIDEMGRLGLAAKQKGYRPAPADVQAFQMALQKELSRMGFQ